LAIRWVGLSLVVILADADEDILMYSGFGILMSKRDFSEI